MLLDYAATHTNKIIRCKASNMVLHVDSNTAYLTMTEARSCYADHYYMSDWPSPIPIKLNSERNGPIHKKYKTIRNVISSEAEAKICGTFNNGITDIDMQPASIELYHKKAATSLKTDNSTTEGFVNPGIKTKHSKTRDMKWHWLRYNEVLDQLRVY